MAAAAACALLAWPAAAQMYPGDNVTVNPNAGTRVLLYPDGKHIRVVPPLLSPGAVTLKPIHLHMPAAHRRTAARHKAPRSTLAARKAPPPVAEATAPPPAAPSTYEAQPIPFGTSLPAVTAAPPPRPKAVAKAQKPAPQVAAAPRQPAARPAAGSRQASAEVLNAPAASGPSTARGVTTEIAPNQGAIPFSFDTPDAAPAPPPPPAKSNGRVTTVIVPPKPAAKHAAGTKLALAEQPPARSERKASVPAQPKGLVKQSEILFDGGMIDPQAPSIAKLKGVAGELNAALDAGAASVEIEAFGGAPGDKSSDARRLSLKRALAVRQLLIDDGVPTDRINVHAMGGIDDRGNANRVDLYLKSG
jgi:outer membrane protein OmpA-like peptidoglycan-associated protein